MMFPGSELCVTQFLEERTGTLKVQSRKDGFAGREEVSGEIVSMKLCKLYVCPWLRSQLCMISRFVLIDMCELVSTYCDDGHPSVIKVFQRVVKKLQAKKNSFGIANR